MKLKYQQFLLLLSTSLVMCFLLSLIIYRNQKEAYLKEVYTRLETVSAVKATRINGIIHSEYELLTFPSTNPYIIDNLKNYLKKPKREYQKNMNTVINQYIRKIQSFNKIYIISPEGMIVASSDPVAEGADWSETESFICSSKGKKYLDGLHWDTKKEINFFLSAPLYDRENFIGVLIVEKNAKELLAINNDYSGLGATGETVISKKLSDKILFLAPLRHDPDAALKRSVSLKDQLSASNNVTGYKKDTLIVSTDYRGEKVIASARYLAETDWALVSKIDYEEALQPVFRLRKFLFLFNSLAVILSLLVSLIMSRYFTKPVKVLAEFGNKIKQGVFMLRENEKTEVSNVNKRATSISETTRKLEVKIGQPGNSANVISRNLQSPLITFEGWVNNLEAECDPLNTEVLDKIQRMKMKIGEMHKMIDNISQTAEEEKKVMEPVNLFLLAQEVVSVLNPPHHVHIFIQHNLPVVRCHRASMLRIFHDLIGNAVKLGDKIQPLIRVGGVESKSYYQISISDNGPGVPKETQETIFKSVACVQTDSTMEHECDLSVVKQLVSEQGGKIWVESEPGCDTKFSFTIPKE